jgi:N-dimethylarginine dimethylaminohydrolase
MCAPTHFKVDYQINPWMHPERPVSAARAQRQWQQIYDQLHLDGHDINLIPPVVGLPDMVFTANAGILIANKALVPRFRHWQRQPESRHFADAFAALGLAQVHQAQYINEGEGDFLLAGEHLLAGTGPRSDPNAAAEVADYFAIPTIALTLVDPRLYHLDTALTVLNGHTIAYWPGAFDHRSRGLLGELYPDAIIAEAVEAAQLGLNIISDGCTAIVAPGCPNLTSQLTERGFRVVPVATDELNKAGGGAKCCVLTHHRTNEFTATLS